MPDLETLEHVREQILGRLEAHAPVRVPLAEAAGRMLAEDVNARDALPPFNASAMDGFGFNAADVAAASASSPVTLRVVGTSAAGDPTPPNPSRGEAVKIFTGALVPENVDTVCPWEDTAAHDDDTVRLEEPWPQGRFVRRRGSDVSDGDAVLEAGDRVTPRAIALLASLGHAEVLVSKVLRVAVHSSGDELVDVTSDVGPGRIRNSNGPAIAARVESAGGRALRRPVIRDDLEAVRAELRRTLSLRPDVIITTGGVSAGERDFIRDVAREFGDDIQVRRIDLKPGKPLVDGHIGGVPYFGLPGNPVACQVSFELFVKPALARLEGRPATREETHYGVVDQIAELSPARRRRFLHARTRVSNDGTVRLEIPAEQESHQIASFARSGALVDVAAGAPAPQVGDSVPYLPL